jgi:Cu+-exporting ATPase
MASTKLKITGMHCASCKALIEDVCGDVPGVRSCAVDIATEIASIEHDDSLNISVLVDEIKKLGEYGATLL